MIQWIIVLLRGFAILFGLAFDLTSMLLVNLPIIAISRGLYVYGYYLLYIKASKRNEQVQGNFEYFTKKESIYFISKNAAVILLGFLNLYIAIFFAVYSLMIASIYLKRLGKARADNKISIAGKILYLLTPFIFLDYALIINDYIALIPLFLAFLVFFYWGNKYANLSLEELFKRYERRLINKIPGSLQFLIMAVIIIPWAVLLIGLNVNGVLMFVDFAPFIAANFNPIRMLSINLPVIIVSRLLFFHSFHLNYIKGEKSTTQEVIRRSFSDRQLIYTILTNALIILFSVLIVQVALFFSIYSLLTSAVLYNNVYKSQKFKKYKSFSYGSLILMIVGSIFSLIFYLNPVAISFMIISGLMGLIFFIYRTLSLTPLTLHEFLKAFRMKFQLSPPFLRWFIIVLVIAAPITLIIGANTIGNNQSESIFITMRDGKKLATDIHYSPLAYDMIAQKPLPAPVVLVRTPYDKNQLMKEAYGTLYLPQGFHLVVQDFRGTHASYDPTTDQEFMLFTKAYTDGTDTIDWILSQNWCNGRIGSAGASALAINQYYYAGMSDVYKADGTGLKCQSLWFGCPDLYLDAIMEGAYHQSSVET